MIAPTAGIFGSTAPPLDEVVVVVAFGEVVDPCLLGSCELANAELDKEELTALDGTFEDAIDAVAMAEMMPGL